MTKRFFDSAQVELLEQIDDFFTWMVGNGSATSNDVDYLRTLVDNLAESVKASERARDGLAQEGQTFEKG